MATTAEAKKTRKTPNMTAEQKKAREQKRQATLKAKKEASSAKTIVTAPASAKGEVKELMEKLIGQNEMYQKDNTEYMEALINDGFQTMETKFEKRIKLLEKQTDAVIDVTTENNTTAKEAKEIAVKTQNIVMRGLKRVGKELTPAMPTWDHVKGGVITVVAQDALIYGACKMSPEFSDTMTDLLAYTGEREMIEA